MSNNRTRRFIAGAICPNCKQQDKTVVYTIANQSYAECVRCGFRQTAPNEKAEKENKPAKKVIWLKSENKAK
jgi:uncharacterized metal-binding protein (TIGR02443 family)